MFFVFFCKQKTAYEMRISDWSSDVCSSDLGLGDYDDAATLLDRQTAILDALDNVPPSLRLESATDLGHTRRMLGRHADCIDGMRPWQALARREAHQLPAQAADVYSQLGRCQHQAGQYDPARMMTEPSLAPPRHPVKKKP